MTELIDIKGLGKATELKLNQASIHTVEDLLMCFPKGYKYHEIQSVQRIKINELSTLKVIVESKPSVFFFRKNLTKLSVKVSVDNHSFRVDIFNRHFLSKVLYPQVEIVVTGRFKSSFNVFTASEIVLSNHFEEGIIPEYKLKDINDYRMRKIIHNALIQSHQVKETIPDFLLDRRGINTIHEVIHTIHQPKDHESLKNGLFRLKYEELIRFALRIELIKKKRFLKDYSRKQYQIDQVKSLIGQIGFELTDSQKKATNDIFRDLKSPHQMNRLLQGDVGSGKTIVAVLAALASVSAGFQVAVMAPTLVLTHQHFAVFKKYLEPFQVRVGILTSENSNKERSQILEDMSNHKIDILIGTHALIQDQIAFHRLGFVIIDEQHRFGVEQRRKLREKGIYPDLLLMSATPIPRSLAISIFESSDVSQITEKPSGRKTIITKIVKDSQMKMVYHRIEKELVNGHGVYVICPLISDTDSSSYYSVEETLKIFKKQFPQYQVASLHGQMPDAQKRDILFKFKSKDIDILISTTVIEVGIHVDDATSMVIMNANAFGLAQLHQLRGRIGRNDLQSYCFLVVDESVEDIDRLSILEKEDDGFKISAYDLRLRGPGEVFGKHQAGIPNFHFVNIIEDSDLLKKALSDARLLIDANDELSNQLKNQVIQTIESYHLD